MLYASRLMTAPLLALSIASLSYALPDTRQVPFNQDNVNQETISSPSQTLQDMIFALDVMQDSYFEQWLGTWPDAIDWTAAVIGTQVSGALSALTTAVPDLESLSSQQTSSFEETLAYENLINRFFDQVSAFYFGENAFSLRMQAFDDMLWVVLGWLESIKFQNLHSELHYESRNFTQFERSWHGTQLRAPAAHRARVFYELASTGWDSELCGGGMIWSPYLLPYKNAITNELFISASIGMYLYYTGDPIHSPFLSSGDCQVHDPNHLAAAVRGYQWLKDSDMTGFGGLYADGFHIKGYQGIGDPGTKKCDELNTMIYTYNQGVILSGLRGLWLATTDQEYLRDGHELVERVIWATGWPNTNSNRWAGLGRGGTLEEVCDAHGDCSQNGQTFKGIFFHHLTEFCHILRPEEERFLLKTSDSESSSEDRRNLFNDWHLNRCRRYRSWIAHNAQAALATRNEHGKFGMWWGQPFPRGMIEIENLNSSLPFGAIDYSNFGQRGEGSDQLVGLLKGAQADQKQQSVPDDGFVTKMGSVSFRNQDDASQSKLKRDVNDRGRGRTVETQSGGLAVIRAWYQWQTSPLLQ